jgi:hypothetical protein
MLIFEFHFESLALAFLSLLYYFYRKDHYKGFLITAILLSLIKENMSLIVVNFGIYALIFKKMDKIRWGVIPILYGAIFFYVTLFIVIPHIRYSEGIATPNLYIGMYKNVGTSPLEILKTFLTQPFKIISLMSTPLNREYLFELFSPLNILPLMSIHTIFLVAPIFLQNLLSSAHQQHTIYFHYAATVVPFLFFASVNSLRFIKDHFKPIMYHSVLFLTFTVLCLSFIYHSPHYTKKLGRLADRLDPIRYQALQQIPKDAGVLATFEFLDHLTNRKKLTPMTFIYHDVAIFSGQRPYQVPDDIDFIVADFSDGWMWSRDYDPMAINKNLNKLFTTNNWYVKFATEQIVVFEKEGASKVKLVDVSKNSFEGQNNQISTKVDDKFSLTDVVIEPVHNNSKLVHFIFYWKAHQDLGDDYYLHLFIHNEQNELLLHRENNIGYRVYPTPLWKQGDHIKEHYWMSLPPTLKGEYEIELSIVNLDSNRVAQLEGPMQNIRSSGTSYRLGKIRIP